MSFIFGIAGLVCCEVAYDGVDKSNGFKALAGGVSAIILFGFCIDTVVDNGPSLECSRYSSFADAC